MDIHKLNPEEAKACVKKIMSGEAFLLDVRTKGEWDSSHAPKSIHFDLQRLEKGELPELAKNTKIFTCCAAGGRAEIAKNILLEIGFSNVKNLGGLRDWKLAGGDVVK